MRSRTWIVLSVLISFLSTTVLAQPFPGPALSPAAPTESDNVTLSITLFDCALDGDPGTFELFKTASGTEIRYTVQRTLSGCRASDFPPPTPLKTTKLSVPLSQLPAGRYTFVVNAVHEGGMTLLGLVGPVGALVSEYSFTVVASDQPLGPLGIPVGNSAMLAVLALLLFLIGRRRIQK